MAGGLLASLNAASATLPGQGSVLTSGAGTVYAPSAPGQPDWTAKTQPTNDTKVATRGVEPDSTVKDETIPTVQTTAQPIAGQPTNTPTTEPDPDAFAVDTYRFGNPVGTDSETTNPLALSDDDYNPIQSSTSTISVTAADPSDGTQFISAYSRFFLQSALEAEQEKYQVVETFTGYYAFFFGKRPPIYRYTGLLISDQNYRWNNDFKFMYENYFRGTSVTELNAQVILNYDSRIITGFPLSLTMQQESSNPKGIPFSMDVLVVSHQPVNYSADVNGLIAQKRQELAEQIAAIASATTQANSASTLTSDNALNGITPPSGVSSPNAPSLGAVRQLA